MRKSRKRQLNVGSTAKLRKLNPSELVEIQELHRIAAGERFKSLQIKGNTALIPDGQKLAEQSEALANLFENIKENTIARKLTELGYPPSTPTTIDLKTGEITIMPILDGSIIS